jgi:hypothetical protein
VAPTVISKAHYLPVPPFILNFSAYQQACLLMYVELPEEEGIQIFI